jgi:nucleoside-diphosphate-sugar epimerase
MPTHRDIPAYGVHERYGLDASRVAADLREAGWHVYVLPRSTDKATFIANAGAVLPLDPPVRTPNWDAFDDSLSSGLLELDHEAIAIVWEDAQALQSGDADAFATARGILSDAVFLLADPAMTGDHAPIRLLVVALLPDPRFYPPPANLRW